MNCFANKKIWPEVYVGSRMTYNQRFTYSVNDCLCSRVCVICVFLQLESEEQYVPTHFCWIEEATKGLGCILCIGLISFSAYENIFSLKKHKFVVLLLLITHDYSQNLWWRSRWSQIGMKTSHSFLKWTVYSVVIGFNIININFIKLNKRTVSEWTCMHNFGKLAISKYFYMMN